MARFIIIAIALAFGCAQPAATGEPDFAPHTLTFVGTGTHGRSQCRHEEQCVGADWRTSTFWTEGECEGYFAVCASQGLEVAE